MEEKIPGLFRRSWGKCMQCGTISELEEYHGLDLTRNPEGKEKLLKGEFFQWSCPKCGMGMKIRRRSWGSLWFQASTPPRRKGSSR